MQEQCVMNIFNLRIHMYNTTGGVAVNKFCTFLCKRRVPILSYQYEGVCVCACICVCVSMDGGEGGWGF